MSLELGKGHFDWIEVRAVGRQEEKRYASRMLVLGLTPNRRASDRHEFPLSIAPMMRTRKSDE
jgi:hypothetical protein